MCDSGDHGLRTDRSHCGRAEPRVTRSTGALKTGRSIRRGGELVKLSHALLLLSVLTIGCSAVDPDDDQIAVVDSTLLTGSVPYRGVSLASAEFAADAWGNGTFPGTHGVDYVYPDPSFVSGYNSADYFIGKGMTTFRLPFRWERLQRTRRQAFDAGELGRLRTTVNRLTSRGAQVVLDPHNYARYGTALV